MQLRYGEPTLRRAVPLALALISVSNPRLNILDTLSKFSHDADPEVSYNSIFAMGMVGSGKPGGQPGVGLLQGVRWETQAVYPTLCLHPLFPRYQQRPAGSDAAAARPVPRQGPQQPLHGAVSPGDDPVLAARGKERAGWGPCPGRGRGVVSWGCHLPARQGWGSQALPHHSLTCFLCHTRA